ncbi:MAG TPA: GTPase [Trichocoleus sp.]|jgi:small GTP-binding protein
MTEDFNFEASVKDALREAFKERGNVNILIAGATGVGKSTLINAIFQGKMADTGQGRPVTPNTREIKKDGIPLSIFDTRGLEMADFAATMNELRTLVTDRARDIDPKKHIHVAWICILEDSRRVQPAEEELVRMLADHMPVVAVITKIRSQKSDKGFRAEVQKLLPLAKNVVRVRALPEEDDDGNIKPAIGLKELVDLTMQLVPEGQKRAFVAAQKIDIELKKTQSHTIVATAAASAAGIAAVPIPFSDAVAIVPIQVGMLAGISATFGLSIDESFLSTVIGSIVVGAGGTFAGRAIVSGLLKFIPGVGSVLGGAIAATTAAALTTAFGEAYIAALDMLFVKNEGEPPTPNEVAEAFKRKYQSLSL